MKQPYPVPWQKLQTVQEVLVKLRAIASRNVSKDFPFVPDYRFSRGDNFMVSFCQYGSKSELKLQFFTKDTAHGRDMRP
jgi:hypothetical protein